MGIGQKLKETFSSDSPDRNYDDTPGSFPSDNVRASDKHTDGSKYSAPTGTAVGGTGASGSQGMIGRAEDAVTGNQYGASGHGIGSSEDQAYDKNVMDPTDRKHGSSLMDSTSAGGYPSTGTGTGDRFTGTSSGDHHNKLYKKDDPRGHDYSSSGSGTDRLTSSAIPERRHGTASSSNHDNDPLSARSDMAGYDRDTSGRYDNDPRSGTSNRSGYERGNSGRYDNEPSSTTSTGGQGHGVYNSIIGTGSQEDTSRSHHHREHNGRDKHDDRATGIGSHDMAHRPHDTSTSNTRDYIVPSGETRVSHGGSGIGSGMGAGATGFAASEAAQHHSGYGHHGATSRSSYDPSSNAPGQRSYDIGNTNSTSTSGQGRHNDSSSMIGSNGQDYNRSYGMGQSHGADRMNDHTQHPQGGMNSGIGSGTSHIPGSNQTMASQKGQGQTGTGGGDRFGPYHPGAQVMHQCQHCGKDNDISQYFHKEAVYRLGQ